MNMLIKHFLLLYCYFLLLCSLLEREIIITFYIGLFQQNHGLRTTRKIYKPIHVSTLNNYRCVCTCVLVVDVAYTGSERSSLNYLCVLLYSIYDLSVPQIQRIFLHMWKWYITKTKKSWKISNTVFSVTIYIIAKIKLYWLLKLFERSIWWSNTIFKYILT